MIPKIIHLCWMSGSPYPIHIQKCIDSWSKYLPDYQIKIWNTESFNINSSIWVKEAYMKKKYAFCADYIRMYALYHYGGIYLDSDVEVIKSFDNLLNLPYFIGLESAGYFEAAVIGSEKGNRVFGQVLDYYKDKHFIDANGELDMLIMPKVMKSVIDSRCTLRMIKNIDEFDISKNIISVFPCDYFSPIDTQGKRYILRVTDNTFCIHHFASAWVPWQVKLLVFIFGNTQTMLKIKSFLSFIQKYLYKKPKFFISKLING